jgi:hypothetical protein
MIFKCFLLSFAMTPRRHRLNKKQVEPQHVILNEVKDLVPAVSL